MPVSDVGTVAASFAIGEGKQVGTAVIKMLISKLLQRMLSAF